MNTSKWKEFLRTEPSPSKAKLRHNLLYVAISLFAKQFYCEQQLDYDFKFGKSITDEEILGIEAHEEVFAEKKVELEELISSIEEDDFCRCTFPLYFYLNDALFLGKPDALIFSKGKPLFLIELKTTSGDPYKVYRSEKNQVYSYAFALEYMGFDCSNLHLLLIKMDAMSYEFYKEECVVAISEEIKNKLFTGNKESVSSVGSIEGLVHCDIVSHNLDFDIDALLKDIGFASEYWLMKREALGADALKHSRDSKCIKCKYKDDCSAYYQYLAKRWSSEEHKKLLEEYSNGTSIEEIAKLLGKSKRSVNQQLIRHKYPKHGKIWSKREIDKLKKLFLQEKAIWYIADVLKRSPSSIISKIKQMGFAQPTTVSMGICNRCYYQKKCVLDVNKRIEATSLESTNVVYQNRGKSWSNDEISRLRDAFAKYESVYELTDIFQRTPKSIMIQLIRNDVISCELHKTMPYMI